MNNLVWSEYESSMRQKELSRALVLNNTREHHSHSSSCEQCPLELNSVHVQPDAVAVRIR